jgi:hypothetical protein
VSILPGVSDAAVAIWQAEARRVDVGADARDAAAEQSDLADLSLFSSGTTPFDTECT